MQCSFCLLEQDNDGVAGSNAYICRTCIATAAQAVLLGASPAPLDQRRTSVEAKRIADPIDFAASLGGLHDFRIDGLAFDTDAQTMAITISAHFDGALRYQGEQPHVLIFDGVSEFYADVEGDEGLRISDLEVSRRSSGFALEIALNIGGGGQADAGKHIAANFKSLSAIMRQ